MNKIQPGRSAFFLAYASGLFAIVLVGFAPTFFLRFLADDPPPLTGYEYLHGAILTGWFVWVVVQAALIRRENRLLHRRLGYVGAAFGVFVMAGALVAPFARVRRILDVGATLDMDLAHVIAIDEGMEVEQAIDGVTPFGVTAIEMMSIGMWASVVSIVTFGAFLGAAVYYRNQSDVHKRLVILASLALIGPALARISRWPVLGGESGPFGLIAMIVLIGVLIGYDLAAKRRVHIATLIGSVVLLFATTWPIQESEFWQPLIRALA